MSFTSSGSQEEVQTVVTLLLLDKMPVAEEQLVVEVSEASASRRSDDRRLSTTDWQVDYTVMSANYSAAMEIMAVAEDMVSSADAVLEDLTEIMASNYMYLYSDSWVMTGPTMVEMGATATYSNTSTASTASSTETATTTTGVTATYTTTSYPYVVQQTISFASNGIQDEVLVVITDLMLTKLEVEEDLLTVILSDSGAWQGSGRRLSSTMWSAVFQVRAADYAAASSVLGAFEDISDSVVIFAAELRSWFTSNGLEVESGSVAVTQPRLMEASEVGAPTGAPTPAPTTSLPTVVTTAEPNILEEDNDADQANAVLFGIIVGCGVLSLCICCVVTEVYVLRRRRARAGVPVNGGLTNAQIRALMDLEGNARPPSNAPGDAEEGNDKPPARSDSGRSLGSRTRSGAEVGVSSNSSRDNEKLHIRLVKAPGEKSGVTLRDDGEALVVAQLQDAGFVREWNRKHPDQGVSAGDRIVSVNGTSGSCSRMRREFELSPTLDITIERVVASARRPRDSRGRSKDSGSGSPRRSTSSSRSLSTPRRLGAQARGGKDNEDNELTGLALVREPMHPSTQPRRPIDARSVASPSPMSARSNLSI